MKIKSLITLLLSIIFCNAYAATEIIDGYTYTYLMIGKDNDLSIEITQVNKRPMGDFKIPEIIGGKKVTVIGHSLFQYSNNLTSIIIPESVTKIRTNAFSECENLRSIKIPESVEEIGSSSFSRCINIKSIILPKKLKVIERSLFAFCTALESIVLPEALIAIKNDAFTDCKNLAAIKLPKNLVIIGKSAFADCKSLTSIEIPSKIAIIERFVFKNCDKLNNVKIPEGVTTIKVAAFYGCDSLLHIKIPNTVDKIDPGTFSINTKLIFTDKPSGVVYFGTVAHGYNGKCPANVVIKDGTTMIMGNTFLGCPDLSNIKIPSSLIDIEYGALNKTKWFKKQPKGFIYLGTILYGCKINANDSDSSIRSHSGVSFRKNITQVSCTYSDNGFKYVFFRFDLQYNKDGMAYVGRIAYRYKGDVSKITFKNNTARIESYCFSDMKIPSIVIPDSVTTIAESAFSNIKELKSIKLPNKIRVIEKFLFHATGLESIVIPNSVHTIAEMAFNGCKNLKKITIGSGVKNIDEFAFAFCESLEEINWRGDCPEDFAESIFEGKTPKNFKNYVSPNAKGWGETFLGREVIRRKIN